MGCLLKQLKVLRDSGKRRSPIFPGDQISDDGKLFEHVLNSRGNISIEVEPDELIAIVQLLKASKDAFINLASEAMDKNDLTKFDNMTLYAKVADKLHAKFGVIAAIGEPESKLLN